jgi:hypothetical protein
MYQTYPEHRGFSARVARPHPVRICTVQLPSIGGCSGARALPQRNSLSSFGSTPALPSQRVVLLRPFSLLAFSNLSPRHFHRQVREASPLQGNFQNSVLLACSSKRGRRNRTDFFIYIFSIVVSSFALAVSVLGQAGPQIRTRLPADPTERFRFLAPASCSGDLARSALARCGFGDF